MYLVYTCQYLNIFWSHYKLKIIKVFLFSTNNACKYNIISISSFASFACLFIICIPLQVIYTSYYMVLKRMTYTTFVKEKLL